MQTRFAYTPSATREQIEFNSFDTNAHDHNNNFTRLWLIRVAKKKKSELTAAAARDVRNRTGSVKPTIELRYPNERRTQQAIAKRRANLEAMMLSSMPKCYASNNMNQTRSQQKKTNNAARRTNRQCCRCGRRQALCRRPSRGLRASRRLRAPAIRPVSAINHVEQSAIQCC